MNAAVLIRPVDIELTCGKRIKQLGIQHLDGRLNLEQLEAHFQSCSLCMRDHSKIMIAIVDLVKNPRR
jgi:hypothetical protein